MLGPDYQHDYPSKSFRFSMYRPLSLTESPGREVPSYAEITQTCGRVSSFSECVIDHANKSSNLHNERNDEVSTTVEY